VPRGDTLQIVIQAVDRATKTLNKVARGTIVATNKMTAAFKRVEASVFSLRGAIAALGAGYVAKQFLDTAASFEKSRIMLDRLMGSAQKGREAFRWILDFGAKAPQGVEAVTDAFVKLKTAGIDPTNGSLQALVDALSAYGKGAEDLKLASIAIQQMMAKGVVSMEELRQQLAERIPDAIQIMADELGLSQQEFQKLVSQGVIPAKEALDALFRGLREKYGGASEEFAQSFSGMVQQLRAQWELFKLDVMDSGVFDFLKAALKAVLDKVKELRKDGSLKEWAKEIGTKIEEAIKKAIIAAGKLYDEFAWVARKLWNLIKQVWDEYNRLPDWFKEVGLFGAIIGGKKGAVLVASFAHLINVVQTQAEALRAIRKGQLSWKEFATSNYKELRAKLDKLKDEQEATFGELPIQMGEGEKASRQLVAKIEKIKEELKQTGKAGKKAGEGIKAGASEGAKGLKLLDPALKRSYDQALKFVKVMALEGKDREIEQAWQKFEDALGRAYEALKTGLITQEQFDEFLDYFDQAWQNTLKDIEGQTKQTASIFEQAWKTAFERVQGWLADFFYSFKLDLKSLGDLFRRVFAEFAAKATMQRFAGAFGLGAFVPGATGAGAASKGGVSWASFLAAPRALWSTIANPQVALASFFGNMPWRWAQDLGMGILHLGRLPFSGLLGAGTALLGGLLTGDWARSIGSGIGAALGNIVLPGIGSALGGLLGGIVGGLFGRKKKRSKLRVGEYIGWDEEQGFIATDVHFIYRKRKWQAIWEAFNKAQKQVFDKWNEEIQKLLAQMPADLATLFTAQLKQMRVYVEDYARSHKSKSGNEREIRDWVAKINDAIKSGVRTSLARTVLELSKAFETTKREAAAYLGVSVAEIDRLIATPGAISTATINAAVQSLQKLYNALSQAKTLYAEIQARERDIFARALSEALSAASLDEGLAVFERSLSETVYRAVVDGFLKAVVQKGIFDKLLAPLLFQFEQLAGKFLEGGLSLDQYAQALQDLVPSLEQVLAQATEAAKPVLEAVYALRTSWPGLESTQTLPTSTTQTIYVQIDARGNDPEEIAAAIRQLARYGEVSVS